MANTIRLRRGSTIPSAGSFVEGEPAWDSTNSKLYIKNAAGTMVEIGAGTGSPGGSTTQVQFNDGGSFAGDVDLTWDKTGNTLTANGSIYADGTVGAGTTTRGIISQGILSFAGARLGAVFQSSQNQYYQVILQNSSSNTNASCDFVVCNDASTDATSYGNFGINSSTYAGAGIFNQPGAVYLTSTSGPLGIGTTTAHDIRFSYNGESTDALTLGANDATFGKTIRPRAGTTADSPIVLTGGTVETVPEAGAIEYDGTFLFATPTTAIGRGQIPTIQTVRLTSNGANIGSAIGDYFAGTTSITLAAASVYEIDYFIHLQKNTAGTLTWTLTASSAPTVMTGVYYGSPITGVAAGTPTTGYAGSRGATTAAFAATGSITNNAFMTYMIRTQVFTNLATNFRLRVTNGAGTVTPLAGSYYTVKQISTTTGNFAA